jgi:hypothetical protein
VRSFSFFWLRSPWGAAVVGVLGLVVGGAIGIAASSGSDTDTTTVVRTETSTRTKTKTVRRVRTVRTGGRTVVRTQTQAQRRLPRARKVFGGQNLSGQGPMFLGIIGVAKTSVLRWSNSGGNFAITTQNKGRLVNSRARSGSRILRRGSYMAFTVKTKPSSKWTVKIRER